MTVSKEPAWVTRGKTVRELIADLNTFDEQDAEVDVSVNDSNVCKPLSVLKKSEGCYLLISCGDDHD